MLSEGRREGLRLALNRSLSEPGEASGEAAVRCPVSLPHLMAPQVVSMPASPCGESATIQRSLLLRRARALQPAEVARKLTKTKPRNFLLVDLRPFISYNLRHVRSAINLNCSDRFNRKRLQLRRASVVDLAVSPSGRDLLKKRCYKEIIVYDDTTSELEALPPTHPVYLVLTALLEDNREPLLLKGEYIPLLSCLLCVFPTVRAVSRTRPFLGPWPLLFPHVFLLSQNMCGFPGAKSVYRSAAHSPSNLCQSSLLVMMCLSLQGVRSGDELVCVDQYFLVHHLTVSVLTLPR